jgi:hypothetical protein
VSLKPVEIGILMLSPKKRPTEWLGEDQKLAHRLVKRGLLASDPADPAMFSCTDEGEATLGKMMAGRA